MSEQRYETKWDAADAVVLPSSYNPGPYDGDDATDAPAMLMGLPIIWGDVAGLVFTVPVPAHESPDQ